MNVVVFQWPWGMAALHRCPRLDRPLVRAMLVLAPFAFGLEPMAPSKAHHELSFFKRDAALVEKGPNRGRPHAHPVVLLHAFANLIGELDRDAIRQQMYIQKGFQNVNSDGMFSHLF